MQEWKKSTRGIIELGTASDEAAKQYDGALSQLCGWYEDPNLGGLSACVERMVQADPDFVLGRAFELELNMMGALSSPAINKCLETKLANFDKLVASRGEKMSELERLHSQVVYFWSENKLKQMSRVLERIVTLYPEDVSALRMLQDTYFMLGTALPMRNALAASLHKMTADGGDTKYSANPLKGYVHGMFAFALEESNMYEDSMREAQKAINLIPRDTWAIHSYAHCLEMQGRTEEGLKWMLDRKSDWDKCSTLASHQYWHTALFHINNSNFDDAVALLDNEVLSRCLTSSSALDLHDGASMIYRMELVDLFAKTSSPSDSREHSKSRWSRVYNLCEPHKSDHLLGFNDAHYMMSFLGSDDEASARELIDSIDGDKGALLLERHSVVKPLLEAMFEFKKGRFSECVELLEPIRFDIIRIGGSHAQRDVFEQLLLVAALKSDRKAHNALGERMLYERDAMFGRRTAQTELLAGTKRM